MAESERKGSPFSVFQARACRKCCAQEKLEPHRSRMVWDIDPQSSLLNVSVWLCEVQISDGVFKPGNVVLDRLRLEEKPLSTRRPTLASVNPLSTYLQIFDDGIDCHSSVAPTCRDETDSSLQNLTADCKIGLEFFLFPRGLSPVHFPTNFKFMLNGFHDTPSNEMKWNGIIKMLTECVNLKGRFVRDVDVRNGDVEVRGDVDHGVERLLQVSHLGNHFPVPQQSCRHRQGR